MTETFNHEQDVIAAMLRAFRKNAGLSNTQLRIKVRDDLYSTAPAITVDFLDSLDRLSFDRLAVKAFDLRLV